MKKFGKNDLFYNTISATPTYKVVFYNGNVTINDQVNEGNRITSSITFLEKNFFYTASVSENFTKNNYLYSASFDVSGTLSYTPTIKRNFVYNSGNIYYAGYTDYKTLKKISALKNLFYKYSLDNEKANIRTFLKNDGIPSLPQIPAGAGVINPLNFKELNDSTYGSSDTSYFINPATGISINLIEIPQSFYGIKIEPGSLNLKIYVTGTLVAEANDKYKNTKIIQTSSSYDSSLVGNEIGMIMYDEGILLITGSSTLANISERYIQPVSFVGENGISRNYLSSNNSIQDNLRWIYFGSHKVTTTNDTTPITGTSYELSFRGSTQASTITMFCNAEKNDLTWSNNRTFISGGQLNNFILGQTGSIVSGSTTYTAPTGSVFVPSNGYYFENDKLLIKNTISSSYTNYEAPYKSQVFISEIGIYNEDGDLIAIAKLANPVKKTPELDYTFKLKLDI